MDSLLSPIHSALKSASPSCDSYCSAVISLLQDHFSDFRRFCIFTCFCACWNCSWESLSLQLSLGHAPAVDEGIANHAGHSCRLQLLLQGFRQALELHRVSRNSALGGPDDRVPRKINMVWKYYWATPAFLPCSLSHPCCCPPSTTWPSSHLYPYNFLMT